MEAMKPIKISSKPSDREMRGMGMGEGKGR